MENIENNIERYELIVNYFVKNKELAKVESNKEYLEAIYLNMFEAAENSTSEICDKTNGIFEKLFSCFDGQSNFFGYEGISHKKNRFRNN